MTRKFVLSALVALILGVVSPLSAIVEQKSKFEYPDQLDLDVDGQAYQLVVTGAALREKTLAKVDIYTIVSYIEATSKLEGDKYQAIIALDAPKRLQLDMRRSVGKDKLLKSLTDIINKNFKDQSAFAKDLATFEAYFDKDAEDGDVLIFDYNPDVGFQTTVNGELQGTITNFDFVKAIWTIWFGEKPANKGMREKLLANLEG